MLKKTNWAKSTNNLDDNKLYFAINEIARKSTNEKNKDLFLLSTIDLHRKYYEFFQLHSRGTESIKG